MSADNKAARFAEGREAPASSRLREAAIRALADMDADHERNRNRIPRDSHVEIRDALDAEPEKPVLSAALSAVSVRRTAAIAVLETQRDEAIARAEQAEAALSKSDPGRLIRELRAKMDTDHKKKPPPTAGSFADRWYTYIISEIDRLLATVAEPDADDGPSVDAGPVDADTAELEMFLSQEARWHQAAVERVVRNLARRELARGAK